MLPRRELPDQRDVPMVPVVPVAGDAELPGAVAPLEEEPPIDELPPMEELDGLLSAPVAPLPIELLPELEPVAPLVPEAPELADGQFMLEAPELAPPGGQSAALPPAPVLPAPEAPELPMLLPDDDGMLDEGEEGLVEEGAAEGLVLEAPPMEEPLLAPVPLLEP